MLTTGKQMLALAPPNREILHSFNGTKAAPVRKNITRKKKNPPMLGRAVTAAEPPENLTPYPPRPIFSSSDAFERVVLHAETSAVGWVEECAAVLAFDDMVGDHPMLGRRAFATHAILNPLAAPVGPAAYDLTEAPVLLRQQFLIGRLWGWLDDTAIKATDKRLERRQLCRHHTRRGERFQGLPCAGGRRLKRVIRSWR
jgi:hypothetical protein